MSRTHQDDAVHLFRLVSEELLHAFLIGLPLELHIDREGFAIHVAVRPPKNHPYVVDGA